MKCGRVVQFTCQSKRVVEIHAWTTHGNRLGVELLALPGSQPSSDGLIDDAFQRRAGKLQTPLDERLDIWFQRHSRTDVSHDGIISWRPFASNAMTRACGDDFDLSRARVLGTVPATVDLFDTTRHHYINLELVNSRLRPKGQWPTPSYPWAHIETNDQALD